VSEIATAAPVTALAAGGPAGLAQTAAAFPAVGQAWFVVIALSLINMVSYVERQILTLLFNPIKHDFHLTDTEVSLLAGAAFVIFFVLFGLAFGRLADHGNRRRIILIGAIFWSLATTACGLARNFAQLFVARICVGVGEATLSPSAFSMMADLFPRERLTRAVSLYTGSQYVGAGLALVVGGLAIRLVAQLPPIGLPGQPPLHPWQLTFAVVGLGGLAFALPLLFAREPARRGVSQAAHPGAPRAELLAFMKLNRRTLICHFAGFSTNTMIGFGVAVWIPTFFIRVHHWAAQDIGYAYGAVMATMGLSGALLGGRLAEWLDARGMKDVYFVLPMITAGLNVFTLAAAMLVPSPTLSLALLALYNFVGTLPLALITTSLQVISPNRLRGQLVAMFMFLANIVGVASGPTVVALLTDYVWRNEQSVGLSLMTASFIITPIVLVLLGFGRKGLLESLQRAQLQAPPSLPLAAVTAGVADAPT
jgi:MFS family permease